MTQAMLTGCFTALVTPFQANGALDVEAFKKLVDWQIAEGIHGLVPVGSTGEAATMSLEERVLVVKMCAFAAGGRVPVIAGAGGNDTRVAIETSKAMSGTGAAAKAASIVDHKVSQALKTWRFWLLWAMLSLNTSAGIMILSQASPLSQQQTSINAVRASFIVAMLSIFNAAGRVFWAWTSDFIGRAQTLFCLFAIQVVLFFTLPSLHEVVLFTIAAGLIVSCYGGGFGVMPAFTADFFGAKYVGGIYGWILVGWGIAAIPSPLLMAHFHEVTGSYDFMLYVIGVVMVISLAFPILARRIVSRIAAASAIEIEGSPAGLSAG